MTRVSRCFLNTCCRNRKSSIMGSGARGFILFTQILTTASALMGGSLFPQFRNGGHPVEEIEIVFVDVPVPHDGAITPFQFGPGVIMVRKVPNRDRATARSQYPGPTAPIFWRPGKTLRQYRHRYPFDGPPSLSVFRQNPFPPAG